MTRRQILTLLTVPTLISSVALGALTSEGIGGSPCVPGSGCCRIAGGTETTVAAKPAATPETAGASRDGCCGTACCDGTRCTTE
jgi:hypothetical protein